MLGAETGSARKQIDKKESRVATAKMGNIEDLDGELDSGKIIGRGRSF